jgi:hypothetical protein
MATIDMPVGEQPKRGFFRNLRGGRRKAAPSTGTTGRDRRPAWLKATDGLAPTVIVEFQPSGPTRAKRRSDRRDQLAAMESASRELRRATRTDTAAVRRRAYLAGCHGRSVAPLMADDLRAMYGPKPTPAQARRIRKADHVEAGQ